jgi:hypothetical protein
MERKIITTTNAPAPVGPYNQAVAVTGQMLFVSGQIALDPASGKLVGMGDVVAQTEQVIANLKRHSGGGWSNLRQRGQNHRFSERYERLWHRQRSLCQIFRGRLRLQPVPVWKSPVCLKMWRLKLSVLPLCTPRFRMGIFLVLSHLDGCPWMTGRIGLSSIESAQFLQRIKIHGYNLPKFVTAC